MGGLCGQSSAGETRLRSPAERPSWWTLNHAYQIPKRSVLAEITLAGRTAPLTLRLFLSEQAATRAGGERPSDLLNGSDGFLPASDNENRVVFLHRQSVLCLSVDTNSEFGGQHASAEDLAPEYAISIQVELLMDNGDCVTGNLRYLMPEGSRRLQDLLNQPQEFLILRDGERARLINKGHILRVAQV